MGGGGLRTGAEQEKGEGGDSSAPLVKHSLIRLILVRTEENGFDINRGKDQRTSCFLATWEHFWSMGVI